MFYVCFTLIGSLEGGLSLASKIRIFLFRPKNNCLSPVTLPTLFFWPYPKSFYDILNKEIRVFRMKKKHEQLTYEPTIYH